MTVFCGDKRTICFIMLYFARQTCWQRYIPSNIISTSKGLIYYGTFLFGVCLPWHLLALSCRRQITTCKWYYISTVLLHACKGFQIDEINYNSLSKYSHRDRTLIYCCCLWRCYLMKSCNGWFYQYISWSLSRIFIRHIWKLQNNQASN